MGFTVQFERDTKASGPEWTSYIDQYVALIVSKRLEKEKRNTVDNFGITQSNFQPANFWHYRIKVCNNSKPQKIW